MIGLYSLCRRESFPGSEPDIVYTVWSFSETNYSIADYTGTFYEKGDWSVEDDVMTLEDESVPILELTAKSLCMKLQTVHV
jgi:hypothetical protein